MTDRMIEFHQQAIQRVQRIEAFPMPFLHKLKQFGLSSRFGLEAVL